MWEPELAPPIECEPALPELEMQDESLQVGWIDPELPWVRRIGEVVPLSPERSVLTGEYGHWSAEGIFVLAFDDTGTTQWEARLPALDWFTLSLVEPSPDGAWFIGAERFSTTVWMYSVEGLQLVQTTVPDLSAARVRRTPGGGLLLEGVDLMQQPAFAELTAGGDVLWQGPANLVAMERVEADGVVQRLDPAGAVVWEHDPRPEPFASFPADVGATWARLLPSGRVVAHGTEAGLGGDTSVVLSLADDGQPQWSHGLPHVTLQRARPLDGERLLVVGRASECTYRRYFAVVDSTGDFVLEGRTGVSALGVDAQGRVIGMQGYDDDEGIFALGWFGQVTP